MPKRCVKLRRRFAWSLIYPVALANMGRGLTDNGKAADALPYFAKAIERFPPDEQFHNNLGVALRQLGRLEEANREFMKAVELRSDYSDALSNLGINLTDMGGSRTRSLISPRWPSYSLTRRKYGRTLLRHSLAWDAWTKLPVI